MVEKKIPFNDVLIDFDTLSAAGTMAGSGGVIVMDDSRDMVEALTNINEFYAHESCGQCTPCREGSLWMQKITDRMVDGHGVEQDPTTLVSVADNIAGPHDLRLRRGLLVADAEFRRKFQDEFAAHAKQPTAAADAAGTAADALATEASSRAASRIDSSHESAAAQSDRRPARPECQRPGRRQMGAGSRRARAPSRRCRSMAAFVPHYCYHPKLPSPAIAACAWSRSARRR